MNTLKTFNTLVGMFIFHNDFQVILIDGYGDCCDDIKVVYTGHVYAKGYSCTINVNYCANSDSWVADVNGFNALKNIKNETELEFAVEHLTQFARSACAEQELSEMKANKKSNVKLYH